MLGRLEMSVDDCISAYRDLGKTVFDKPNKTKPIFDARILEAQIKQLVERCLGNENAALLNEDTCKTYVGFPTRNSLFPKLTALYH